MARLVVVLACLALSACGSAQKPEGAGNAAGKVLAGSISDAMVDLDKSHAEAPLAGPGSGIPAGDSEAARDLLASLRSDGADEPGATASDSPAAVHDQDSKPAPPTAAPAARDKPAEPAADPAKKPVIKPAASVPAKPRVRPAFRKPTDDSGV